MIEAKEYCGTAGSCTSSTARDKTGMQAQTKEPQERRYMVSDLGYTNLNSANVAVDI